MFLDTPLYVMYGFFSTNQSFLSHLSAHTNIFSCRKEREIDEIIIYFFLMQSHVTRVIWISRHTSRPMRDFFVHMSSL